MVKNQHSYTEQDRIEVVREIIAGKSYTQITQEYGVSKDTCTRWKKKYQHLAELREGYLPENHEVKGTSVMYDAEGNIKLQWVKTDRQFDDTVKKLERIAAGLIADIEPIEPREFKGACQSALLSNYVISDFHLGQYSDPNETGDEWNLEHSKNVLCKWIEMAILTAPKAEQAVLVDLGDFLHADGLLPLTPASKHVLDASGRFHECIDVAIYCFDFMIDRLLEHHKNVHIIIAEGNHNESSAHWMTRTIARKFEKEPRVTFDLSDIPYYAYEWGDTSLFYHHGHKKKMGVIAESLAAQFRDIYGKTKYSYAHTGHLHHREIKENSMMIVEQHSTLAAKDAHSARGGYHSQRGASVITYHKKFGEVGRATVRPEMLI